MGKVSSSSTGHSRVSGTEPQELEKRFVVQPGDILAVQGSNWLSRGIIKAERREGSPYPIASHVGMITADKPFLQITEALTRVRTRPIWLSIAEAKAAWIIQAPLTPEQRIGVVQTMLMFSADGYNYVDILLQLLNATFHTTFWTNHLAKNLKGKPICSFAVASSFESVGINFGQEDNTTTPADVVSFAVENKWPMMSVK